jgi:uncharacterized protein with LGFP repeats
MPSIDEKEMLLQTQDPDGWNRLGSRDPLGREDVLSDGLRRHYANGVILWRRSTDQAWAVYGAIYQRYQQEAEVAGPLGWPTSDELQVRHGRASHFEYGDIYWNGGPAYIVFPSPAPDTRDPTIYGQWAVHDHGSGVVGVHAALLPTGGCCFLPLSLPKTRTPRLSHNGMQNPRFSILIPAR